MAVGGERAEVSRRTHAGTTGPGCAECGGEAVLVTGLRIYPHRPDLHARWYWRCSCGAYVGCHRDGDGKDPLGLPAGAETRRLRMACHAIFDPLWERKVVKDGVSKKKARGAAYRWLAGCLEIRMEDCHISHFGEERARAALEVLQPFARR